MTIINAEQRRFTCYFPSDIAQVIVMEDQELMRQKDEHEERGTRRKVAAIKRAGNPQYYGNFI